MREYVWIIVIIGAILVLATLIISICIMFCKSNNIQRSNRRRISPKTLVQPITATPISVPIESQLPVQTSQSPTETHLTIPSTGQGRNGSRTLRGRSSAPSMMMMRNNATTVNGFASPEPETAFTNDDCFNMKPKAVRSLSTISGRVSANHDDRPFGSTFMLRPRRSTEFVDRDPISDESRCDYLDLLDFGSLQQSKSEHELTSVAKGTLQAAQPLQGARRPHFGSVECIHREDIRYLHS